MLGLAVEDVSFDRRSPGPRCELDASLSADHSGGATDTDQPPLWSRDYVSQTPTLPDYVAVLLVYGPDIPKGVLEMLSVQLELLLEEFDREESANDAVEFDWKTVDPSFHGNRVVVAPSSPPSGAEARTAGRIVERIRRGVSVLNSRPVRPPAFTRLALQHLEWIASAIDSPGVDRIMILSGGMAETISRATLSNLRTLSDGSGRSGQRDVRSR